MKIVLDTNVLISSLLFKKQLSPIFDILESGKIIPCFTLSTLKEFSEVLNRPKFLKKIETLNLTPSEIISAVLENSQICPEKKIPNIIPEDPSDNKFLACAISCQASFIVSGDSHLLKLKKFQEIPILQPKEFLKIIS